MSTIHAAGAMRADPVTTSWACRCRRLDRERAMLAGRLQDFVAEIPDALSYDLRDLRHLAGYRILEPEGLVHCSVLRTTDRITVLAATGRVFKRPDLRLRLFALRRLARIEFKRVLIATPRGLIHATNRLRARRAASLVVAPER